MSIASKLQDILAAKADIKDAINAKGGEVTAATPLADYAQAIDNLPSGISVQDICEKKITGDLIIPQGTTQIKNYAFYNMPISSITFPESLTTIASYAFTATGLLSLTLPSTIISVGAIAFNGCKQLNTIIWNSSHNSIGQQMFEGCINLTSVVISDNVTRLERAAFQNCTSLIDFQCGTGISYIGQLTFRYSDNVKLRIPTSTPPTLDSTAFGATFAGAIYVPDEAVNDYKTATNWSAYAQYIYPLSDYTP